MKGWAENTMEKSVITLASVMIPKANQQQ